MFPLMMFYLLIFMSLFISMSSTSILLIWVALELNLLSFLPIMSSESNLSIENSMKYFLVQSWASILFLTAFMASEMLFSSVHLIMTVAMLMKLGTPPFHMWFIIIMKTSPFFIIILLSTVQKMIPLYFISNIFFSKALFFLSIFLTSMFSAALLWTIVSMGKLLAISSIINMNWILISTQISFKLVFLFMFIYLHLLLGLVLILNKNNSKTFIQSTSKMGTLDKVGMILVFMSLGGLPPLLGFLMKLVILKFILLKNNIILATVLVFLSLMLLFHYLSRSYYLLTMYPSMKFITKSSAGGSVFYFFYFFSLIWFNMVMVGTL